MSQPTPQTGYIATHYRLDHPSPLVHLAHSPIHPTLSAAQAHARREFAHFLNHYLHTGFHGEYCDDLDLSRRAHITAHVRSCGPGWIGPWEEVVLSEFVISEEEIQGSAVRSEGLFGNGGSVNMIGHRTASAMRLHTFMMRPGPDFALEGWYEWTQTRLPRPGRRDDGPFRRPDDPPYDESMGFESREGGGI